MKEKSKSLYGYFYNVCILSEPIQHTLINFFNLDKNTTNFIEIKTSVDLDVDDFLKHLEEHGIPSDAKITLYKDVYPVSCCPDSETCHIHTIEFQGGRRDASKTNGSTEANKSYARRNLY